MENLPTVLIKKTQNKSTIYQTRGVFRGGYGAMGAKPAPEPVISFDLRGFSGPNGC